MEYVRRLLKQKQPAFVASLELAVSLVERNCASPSLCRGMLTPLRQGHFEITEGSSDVTIRSGSARRVRRLAAAAVPRELNSGRSS